MVVQNGNRSTAADALARAEQALADGSIDAGDRADDALAAAGDDRLARARARRCQAAVAMWRGDVAWAASTLEATAEQVVDQCRTLAGGLALEAVTAWLHVGSVDAATRSVATARSLTAGGPEAAAAELAAVWIEVIAGRDDGRALLALGAGTTPPLPSDELALVNLTGALLVWTGQFDEARRRIARATVLARNHQQALQPFLAGALAELDFRTGRWEVGAAVARDGLALAQRGNSRNVAGMLHAHLAMFAAVRGDADLLEVHGAEAESAARASGVRATARLAAAARGMAALGAGHQDRAVGELSLAAQILDDCGIGHPGVAADRTDLVEALAGSGRADEARALLDELDARFGRADHPPTLAALARGRLWVAPDGDVDPLAVVALRHHDEVPLPFERGRTMLVVGRRRRRAGNRAGARQALSEALALFTSLRAEPWVDQTAAELLAAGGRVDPTGGPVERSPLSPQERRVVEAVRAGLSNREIGTTLFLSTKSVERHLTSIYRKLGVRSRTELLARTAAAASGDQPV